MIQIKLNYAHQIVQETRRKMQIIDFLFSKEFLAYQVQISFFFVENISEHSKNYKRDKFESIANENYCLA